MLQQQTCVFSRFWGPTAEVELPAGRASDGASLPDLSSRDKWRGDGRDGDSEEGGGVCWGRREGVACRALWRVHVQGHRSPVTSRPPSPRGRLQTLSPGGLGLQPPNVGCRRSVHSSRYLPESRCFQGFWLQIVTVLACRGGFLRKRGIGWFFGVFGVPRRVVAELCAMSVVYDCA